MFRQRTNNDFPSDEVTENPPYAVFAVYRTEDRVHSALETLRAGGFPVRNVAVLLPDHTDKFGHPDIAYALHMKITTGAIVGAIVGATVGIAVALAAISGPHVELLEYAVWTRSLLASIVGAFLGTLLGAGSGALIGIGTPEKIAERYSTYVNEGGILLSVHLDDSSLADRVREILGETGGEEVSLSREDTTWKDFLSFYKTIDQSRWKLITSSLTRTLRRA